MYSHMHIDLHHRAGSSTAQSLACEERIFVRRTGPHEIG